MARGTRNCVIAASFFIVAAAAATAPSAAAPYADGAPPGFSGGFKEQSCNACHFEAEPNTAPGSVTLSGVPERFTPGQRYPLSITLTRPGMKIGGFQLAARFADGTQAGTLERDAADAKRIAIEAQGKVHYANQRRPGADLTATDSIRWTVIWTAPATSAAVTFHVAANAANGDEAAAGDYVFTTTAQTR